MALSVLIGVLLCAAGAGASRSVTQRQMNVWAAELDRGVREILVVPGIRAPGEPLAPYLLRIAGLLPGELPEQRQQRVAGYVRALERAGQSLVSLRRTPDLQDRSPANLALWQGIVRGAGALPLCARLTRQAWLRARDTTDPVATRRLAEELERTLRTLLATRDGLRDARP
ncbi:MAG: hypothetical protein RMJ43_11610 [Chloroherpetonaceae bacterium]|nr:hypothetical protein [Chthonomonadaceae bacterium]MDW8208476.1 hypothetical protein [Chloroherpetonaceae bacterium]